MNKIETSKRGPSEETKLSAEELAKESDDLFNLALDTVKRLPGFPMKYKEPGVTLFPPVPVPPVKLNYSAECQEVEGKLRFNLIGFSRDVNTHIWISPNCDTAGSIRFCKIPVFANRKRFVFFMDSVEAARGIRDFLTTF